MMLLPTLSACGSDYPESVESKLRDGVDYVDHTTTYDGEGLSYDESMWYVNTLDKVPLPDPHVYVEGDTYYIVGTSDRDGSVIDCYTTEDFVTFERHIEIYNPKLYHCPWKGSRQGGKRHCV